MPKVVSHRLLKEKWNEHSSVDLFEKIEKFASYGFNKSHSIEYTLISYQAMWLKTFYPVEFFASALSLMKEERLPALLKDAARFDIKVSLPDINKSTDRFEIISATEVAIPFTRIKGMSDNGSKAIVDTRGALPFKSKEDFETRITEAKVGRHVHKGKINTLDLIGAFCSIEPTTPPQNDDARIKAQKEFIPGLITDTVPVYRVVNTDRHHKLTLIAAYAKADRDDTSAGAFVMPQLGKTAKFTVVTDAPTPSEVKSGKVSVANSFVSIAEALAANDLTKADGHWTTLIKKAKTKKAITPDEIKAWMPLMREELEILKPPVVVLCGSTTIRQFLPDFKGRASDEAGRVHYDKASDTNWVIGFSPGEIFHAPEKQEIMNKVFAIVAELVG